MEKIKIIDTPPGFAPEYIRKQWIDIEIALMSQEDPNEPLGLRSGVENIGGYQVSPIDAIDALRAAGKDEAANFWEVYSGALNFTFKKDVCTVLSG